MDHSISSTINLPEDIEPELISDIYLHAWEQGLKGITIYRDGSRFPILTTDTKKTDFQHFKKKKFEIPTTGGDNLEIFGDEIIRLENGSLSTPYHLLNKNIDQNIKAELKVEEYDHVRK